jgi:hypothetical protein
MFQRIIRAPILFFDTNPVGKSIDRTIIWNDAVISMEIHPFLKPTKPQKISLRILSMMYSNAQGLLQRVKEQ